MKKNLGFPVLSFLGCLGLSLASLLSLTWNVSWVSSRQLISISPLRACEIVMVMVFGHSCGHNLGLGHGHGHSHGH